MGQEGSWLQISADGAHLLLCSSRGLNATFSNITWVKYIPLLQSPFSMGQSKPRVLSALLWTHEDFLRPQHCQECSFQQDNLQSLPPQGLFIRSDYHPFASIHGEENIILLGLVLPGWHVVAGECENGTSPRANIKTEDESLREAVMKSSERWQQPRETIPLKLWSRVRRLLVRKGRKGRKAVRGYWQLYSVNKSPFIMKYGVKLEVLTAEGPDRAAMQTSARKQKGREVELGEEGVGEEKRRDSVCNEDLRRTLNLASLSLSQGQSVFAKPNYMRKGCRSVELSFTSAEQLNAESLLKSFHGQKPMGSGGTCWLLKVVIPVCFTLVHKGCGIKPVIYSAILQETDIDGAEPTSITNVLVGCQMQPELCQQHAELLPRDAKPVCCLFLLVLLKFVFLMSLDKDSKTYQGSLCFGSSEVLLQAAPRIGLSYRRCDALRSPVHDPVFCCILLEEDA
ncbi:hypothetical protein Anapl_13596 [Anas platyrhynchos]|uniref:Uncharacterized protein n=1 Tax=Anas platyrhynchos TaxID=8839 RepID=R0LGC5_ANAPL|nr:hypothetical protein Anapl_13596 [Anas platyrhynchos]